MNTRFLRNIGLVLTIVLVAGCANSPFYHRQVMAGQVVQASIEGPVIVCIGEPGGAEVGQVLSAYRVEFRKDVVEEGESYWARKWVGKVRINGIIDEHFATAGVVEGHVLKNDIVALER
ncbi:hypothetical protein [Cellvibrio sp. QJXJ]|uniref:hypothetical protein n=1 Tax=Cellvibrio sp. QJXJ TaxID=2964606 RepID=UPI0021C32D07|nr:hypothetical protein [Cellvibrio sp. QJXJ]UUA75004.1 hypothetical protein NNX04_21355 [Cellvibrio sp. QJXJ]